MPIPKPEETKNAYLNRCMSEAKNEYPNQEQRIAYCEAIWDSERLTAQDKIKSAAIGTKAKSNGRND